MWTYILERVEDETVDYMNASNKIFISAKNLLEFKLFALLFQQALIIFHDGREWIWFLLSHLCLGYCQTLSTYTYFPPKNGFEYHTAQNIPYFIGQLLHHPFDNLCVQSVRMEHRTQQVKNYRKPYWYSVCKRLYFFIEKSLASICYCYVCQYAPSVDVFVFTQADLL